MDLARTAADRTATTPRAQVLAVRQTMRGLGAAIAGGLAALISPPAALLVLALLAARAALRTEALPRLRVVAVAGPILAALIVGSFVGLAGAVGVIFIWRVIADARWSAGEARRLAVIAGRPSETRLSALGPLWTTPLYGLAVAAYTAPHMIAGLPLDLPHVPHIVPTAMAALAFVAVADWALRRAADWRLGELAPSPCAHVLAHHALFLAAYVLTPDLSAGLVAVSAWRLAHAAPGPLLTLPRGA